MFHRYSLPKLPRLRSRSRSHGQSSRTSSWTQEDFDADTARFVKRPGIRNPFVRGHSLGGAISSRFFGDRDIPILKLLLKDIGPEIELRDRPTAAPRPLSRNSYDTPFAGCEISPQWPCDPAAFIANNRRCTGSGGLAAWYDPEFSPS